MATDLKEVLSKYVPEHVLDDVAAEVQEAATPDSFRKELGELGAKAKEADALRDELESIKSAPKRKEALKRVGVEYDKQPKYGQKTLDAIPHDKLDDLQYVANFVKEEGFEATLQTEEKPGEKSGAERITDFTTSAGNGAPVQTSDEAKEQAFYADVEKVPDGDKNAMREVLIKHGRFDPSKQG